MTARNERDDMLGADVQARNWEAPNLGAKMAAQQYSQSDVPAVPRAFDELERAQIDLYQVVDALESRLDSVLSPSPPKTGVNAWQSPTPRAVAHRLMDHVAGLRTVSERLRSLLERLEV